MTVSLICPRWIAPVEPAGIVLTDHAVAIDEGRIVALLPRAEALRRWPQAECLERPTHLLTPGLVNLHTHAGMTLLRGAADDLPLERWLRERIWPIESALMSPEYVFDGSVLAVHEMLRGGVTCFNDMYFHPDQCALAATALGIRASLGIVVLDAPTSWASSPADYLAKGLAIRDQWRDEPLISFTLAPHAPYTVSDDSFRRVGSLSAELGLPIHCHVHETAAEIQEALHRTGQRPLQRLHRLGLLGPDFIAVHAVHLDDGDLALLADQGVSVAHCPTSNMKLASGFCPSAALLRRGVNVGIGTDSAASNNRLDLLGETRMAALIGKGYGGGNSGGDSDGNGGAGRADAWSAHQSLRAATLAGAQALGLADRIGSITVGKDADLVAFDLAAPNFQPAYDPVSLLIYTADRSAVTDVWVNGSHVVLKRQLVSPSGASLITEVSARIALWQNRIGEFNG